MDAVAPVTPQMWERLRRLDARCDISLVRTQPSARSQWQRYPRVWVATIRERSMVYFDIAQADHPVFAEAVREAIEIAERKGWHKAKVPEHQPPHGCGTVHTEFSDDRRACEYFTRG